LIRFLKSKFAEDASRTHVFVSFNYDLALDRAIELASDRDWQPQGGYGLDFQFYIVDNSTACTAERSRSSQRIQILKPHGSLNWLRRKGTAGTMVVPLNANMELRYWPIANEFHPISFESQPGSYDFGSPNVEIAIAPPSRAKPPVMPQIRGAEMEAVGKADEVLVIGYSLPKTDLDQWNLISEAVGARRTAISKLTIISYNSCPEYFQRIEGLFGSELTCKFNDGFAKFSERW
jgi:hypothetical protein